MIIGTDFEDDVLASDNPNYIILTGIDTFVDITYTVTGASVSTFTNRYAQVGGVSEINIQEIAKLVHKNKHTDPFTYVGSVLYLHTDPYHIVKIEMSIVDNLPTTVTRTVWIVNGVLQTGDITVMSDFNEVRLAENSILLPHFTGYPKSISTLKYDGILLTWYISRKLDVKGEQIDECGTYIKWKNHKGGYAYWLFDIKSKDKTEYKSLGALRNHWTDRTTAIGSHHQLGKSSKHTRLLNTVVHDDYIDEFKTIFDSDEIYLYKGEKGAMVNLWEKVGLVGNITESSSHIATKIKLTIELSDKYSVKLV